jgi:hypothetical protein
MYLDIPACANCPEGAMATFKEIGPARPLRRVRLHLDGGWRWCAVTGWEGGGVVPAAIVAIEESGDGPALLVVGGGEGLRLARLPGDGAEPRWSQDASDQWGEPFLICRPDCRYE